MNLSILITCLISAFMILLIHESGHLIAAKLLKIKIDKIGFSSKPFPQFYVSVIDHKLTLSKRIIFLLSGNAMVVTTFIIYLLSGFSNIYIFYILALQILIDTNPVYSDYVIAIASYLYRKDIRKHFFNKKTDHKDQAGSLSEEIKEKYKFSKEWYLHMILWGGMIILLYQIKYLFIF